ncbi:MAG: AAA family ATPase [Alphaproteobacteria bacterium]|nr:AAA family ATPase [Alphaproteobacteria bacterium]
MPDAHTPQIAAVTLEGPLGAGGMGKVLRGRHRSGLPVAVKLLTTEGLRSPALRLAFGNEVRAVAALNHPGVVPILDYGTVSEAQAARDPELLTAGSPYLVMPLAEGGTASGLRGRLRWATLAELMQQLLDALGHCHARGVLHRDIKPSNVLRVDARDLSAGIWLADFGLASLDPGLYPDTAAMHGGGTVGFRAPEQQTPMEVAQGPWTDLFALGRLALVLVTQGGMLDEVPAGFWDWVAWLSAEAPEARPRFAAQAAQALAQLSGADWTPAWREEPARSSLEPVMSRAVLGLREPPLVGRSEARARLWRSLERARATQRPALALLTGPPGIGRTRLGRWIAEQAHGAGLARVSMPSLARGLAARDPLAQVVEQVLGLAHLRPRARRRALAAALERRGWSPEEVQRLDAHLQPPSAAQLSLRVGGPGDRVGLLRRAVLDLARAWPLVLVLDDAQLDGEALRFAESLALGGGTRGAALLLVLTAPDRALGGPLAALLETGEVEHLTLEALDEAEMRALLRDLLGERREVLGRIAERAGGDPGFAVQLVRHFAEGAEPDAPLPDGLQDVFTQRLLLALARCSGAARRAVFLAAALGPAASWASWRACCAAAELEARSEGLDALAQAGLLESSSLGPRFATGLVRESLLALAEQEGGLADLHAACARGLPEPEPRALHHLLAGEPALALEPLALAMQSAVRRGVDYAHLALLLQRWDGLIEAGAVARRGEAYLRGELGAVKILQALARKEEQLRRARSLFRDADELGIPELRAGAAIALSYACWMRGELAECPDILTRAREGVQGGDLAEVLATRAMFLRALGRMQEAERDAEEAWSLRGDGSDPRFLEALRFKVNQAVWGKRVEEALALSHELRERAEALGHTYYVGIAWNNIGCALEEAGDVDAAVEALTRSARILDSMDSRNRRIPRINAGALLIRQARHGEARRLMEQVTRHSQGASSPIEYSMCVTWLLRALAGLGAWEAVRPEWAELEMLCARTHPQDTVPTLRDCAELAEAAQAPCAPLIWGMLARAARQAQDAEALALAEAALARAPAVPGPTQAEASPVPTEIPEQAAQGSTERGSP